MSEFTRLQIETYREGYDSRQRGEPEESNPYRDDDDHQGWWWNGWLNGNGGTSPGWYSRVIQGD